MIMPLITQNLFKQCTICKETKFLDEFAYRSIKNNKRHNRCKKCCSMIAQKYTLNQGIPKPRVRRIPGATSKVCTKCGMLKPLEDYYRDRNRSDNRHSQCKTCANIAIKQWNKKHRERRNLQAKKRNKSEHYKMLTRARVKRWKAKQKNKNLEARAEKFNCLSFLDLPGKQDARFVDQRIKAK